MSPARGCTRTTAFALAAFSALGASRAQAQTYYMPDYWLMPSGVYANLFTVFRSGGGCPGGTTTAPHAFWRGSLWGRTVALQGGTDFAAGNSAYDIFVPTASNIEYWGTFRGNDYYSASPKSNSFSSAFVFMNNNMAVGSATQASVTDNEMFNYHRRKTNSGSLTLRVDVVARYATWTDPDSGLNWSDVLKIVYTITDVNGSRPETYYLAKGKGTVRFESGDPNEPSCVVKQYATSVGTYTPQPSPTLPWYDPFMNTTYAPNGFFEDFLIAPVNGGAPLSSYERSWTGYSNGVVNSTDVAITTDGGDPGTSAWKIALRAAPTAGYDFAISAAIPVTPGKRYRLSGRLWRVSAADRVYLDFNDGNGGVFADVDIVATTTNTWEYVQGETTVGSATSIRVRCVRDMGNQANAYCDGITLQRVN